MAENSESKCCKGCKSWAEAQICPDHGFCSHPNATTIKVAPGTSLSSMLLPGITLCRLAP